MTIADKLTLLASSKEALRIKLGLPESLPFSEYYKYALTYPDAAILNLFAGGKQGVWYDPSDKTTLFQDVAGTVPVTKDGDPVALMRDKSGNGNHASVTVSTARPVYKTDGVLHWLAFDGIDDHFVINYPLSKYELWLGIELTNTSAGYLFDMRESSPAYYFGVVGSIDTRPPNVGLLTPRAFADRAKVVGLNLDFTSSKMFFMTRFNVANNARGNLFSYIQVAGSLTSDARLKISDYLAKKSGVTL